MIDRRDMILGAAAVLAAGALPYPLRAAASGPLRIASVKFGSVGWLLETIRAEGLDAKNGVKLEIIDLANNPAGPVALLGGGADVIVSDWTWAMRQRSMGEMLKFAPYSSALGSLVVPKDSPIQSLAGIKGKKLGVAGSSIDKSWLLLRAYTKKTLGSDLSSLCDASFGAAPLLHEEIKNGRVDAVLNFWTFTARLTGTGFRPILSMADVMRELGISPVPSLVGFIWKESYEAENGAAVAALLKAADEANVLLAKSDAPWERLKLAGSPVHLSDAPITTVRRPTAMRSNGSVRTRPMNSSASHTPGRSSPGMPSRRTEPVPIARNTASLSRRMSAADTSRPTRVRV